MEDINMDQNEGPNGSSETTDGYSKETELTGIQPRGAPFGNKEEESPLDSNKGRLRPVDGHEDYDDEDYDNDAVGASLPTPEEIRAEVSPRRKSRGVQRVPAFSERSNSMLVAFVLSLIFVIILSVGLGVGLSNREEEQNQARKSTPESIRDYVISQGISMEDDFDVTLSPQNEAAMWMARRDARNLATPNPHLGTIDVSDETYAFALRYVMAVVYFSTGGATSWNFQFNFLSGLDTCDWNGSRKSQNGGEILFGLECFDLTKRARLLYLDHQNAIGSIPREIGVLKTLVGINFNYNIYLDGTLPTTICSLRNLENLAVGFTKVNGRIPSCINQMSRLELLFLPNNQLTGELPRLETMTSLTRINLDDNKLQGDITTTFNNLRQLRFLFLEDNDFTGNITDNFLRFNTNLRYIDLSDLELQGEVPIHFFEFEDLVLLELHGNEGITGQLPDLTSENDNLLFLALQGCNIQGSIPPSISNLVSLFHLDLAENDLTGDIPAEIGDMTSLSYLFLGDNIRMDPGPVPDTFENLDKLTEFSLRGLRRVGELPSFISNMTSLQVLDLSENDFNGNIPSGYGDLTNLEFFLLNNNLLAGNIPESFQNLENLRILLLHDNSFKGDVSFMCTLPTFQEPDVDSDGKEILTVDCDGGQITCNDGCCVCCNPFGLNDTNAWCHGTPSPNLNPVWENGYQRVEYSFGNQSRYTDRAFID